MKYFAIIRLSYTGGNWISGSGSHVYKSLGLDTKKEAKDWICDTISKLEKDKSNDEWSLTCETILALDENESENYEEFIKSTYN